MSRLTREMFCLMEGRHVHPSTLYPGGVGTVPSIQLFTEYQVRLLKYVEFMKKVVPLHDDLFNFFYEALPGYEEVGRRRVMLGCWGSFNDPEVCDYTYRRMSDWGRAMFVTPGIVIDGELITTDLVEINLGLRILLGSSFYDDWQDAETFVKADPLGNPVDRRHPWNQTTLAKRQKRDFAGNYSWVMSPRWYDARTGEYRRSTPAAARCPALGHRPGRPGRHRLRQGRRPRREDPPAEDDRDARDRARVDDPALEQHPGARPGPDLFPGLRRGLGPVLPRPGDGGGLRGPDRAPGPSTGCPTRRSAAASTRPSAACCRTTW